MSVEERQLYQELKELSDFDCFPLPRAWYKEFGIPFPQPLTTSEFMKSNYTSLRQFEPKSLPPLIFNEPQDNGRLLIVPKFDEILVEVINGKIPDDDFKDDDSKELKEEHESQGESPSEIHISKSVEQPLPECQSQVPFLLG